MNAGRYVTLFYCSQTFIQKKKETFENFIVVSSLERGIINSINIRGIIN